MTSRERMKTLLAKEIPDKMGLYENYWQDTIKTWEGQGYPKDTDVGEYFGYDLVSCGGWLNVSPFMQNDEVIEETDEWKITKNGSGATMKHWKERPGVPEHISFDVTTPEKWQKYRDPLLGVNSERLGDTEEIKKDLAKLRKGDRFIVFGNLFIFELMRGTMGDQNFLPALLLEPDWIKDFCQVYLDFYRAHYDMLFSEVGKPDGMFIYEDFGYNKGLFCSPDTMAEMVFPYEKQLVSFFHDHGLPVILHTCGGISKAVPHIIDAGFDCLQPMEAKAGCDVIEYAETYGNKISYMGNINVMVLETGDRNKIKAEIVPKLTKMKEMKMPYSFHSDHSLPSSVSYETYTYAMELLKEHGVY